MIPYALPLGLALFAIAVAGIASHKNLIVIMLGIELILVASTIVLVYFFAYGPAHSPDGIIALFSIWSVASAEIIAVIAFYVYMKSRGIPFDVSKLSRMKW